MLVAASPRQFLSFDQWDVHQDDLLEIDAILSINSINESFWKYLHHPRNPSSNFEVYFKRLGYLTAVVSVLFWWGKVWGTFAPCLLDISFCPSASPCPRGNRQTLYLLGFQRVACNSTRCGGNACICNASQPGYPAITYDWDNDGTGLLESAKAHLRSSAQWWSGLMR